MNNIQVFVPVMEDAKSEGVRKGFGMIISFVAMVFIPYASPYISGAIGLTGAIGAQAGSALVGAGLGAATSYATGGNVGVGALTGALGGWGGAIGGGGAGVNPGSGAAGVGALARTGAGVTDAAVVGGRAFTGAESAAALGGASYGGQAASALANMGQTATQGANVMGGVSAPTAASAELGAGQGTMNAISRMPQDIVNSMGGPDKMAAMLTRVVAQGAAGDPYMQEALEQRRAELEAEKKQNEALYNKRLEVANRLLDESKYFDPAEGGRRAALDVQQRIGEQEEDTVRNDAARRGYNTGRRRVIGRQAGLAAGRGAANAYKVGADAFQTMKLNTIGAARQWMPDNAPSSWASSQTIDNAQRDIRGAQINEMLGWGGYATANPYRPQEEDQWPQDRVGVWQPRG